MDLVEKVEQLLKLPQKLCNKCGRCCKIAIFKGGLNYEEVKKIAQSTTDTEEEFNIIGARSFLSIFVPFDSVEDVKKHSPEFTNKMIERFGNDITFFYCKFLSEKNFCLIHEDRPNLCRAYPFPHEKTIYHPGCGFEKQGIENWNEICKIQEEIEQRQELLRQKLEAIEKLNIEELKKLNIEEELKKLD